MMMVNIVAKMKASFLLAWKHRVNQGDVVKLQVSGRMWIKNSHLIPIHYIVGVQKGYQLVFSLIIIPLLSYTSSITCKNTSAKWFYLNN